MPKARVWGRPIVGFYRGTGGSAVFHSGTDAEERHLGSGCEAGTRGGHQGLPQLWLGAHARGQGNAERGEHRGQLLR
jgi:hypothetical protein